MKRFATIAAVAMTLMLAVPVAAAKGETVVETIPMTFAPLNSDTCQFLPDGTSITWSGTGKSITRTTTDTSGVTTIRNVTHANGFATDQDGNSYRFNYSNSFSFSNSVADPGIFSGKMVDAFSLAGPGGIGLDNGFVAIVTTDFATFSWDVITSRGDPISFTTGPVEAHCDPL
jgi:hypothetical protein